MDNLVPLMLKDHNIPYFPATFMFFSRSADVAPGLGAEESIHPDDMVVYAPLRNTPKWRQALSNFAPARFTQDELTWNSAEHYFHAQKYRSSHPDYFRKFAIESGDTLATAAGADVRKAGRAIKMTQDAIEIWSGGKSSAVIFVAQLAKFRQNADAREVLIATHDAVLKHKASFRDPVVIEHNLMLVREVMKWEHLGVPLSDADQVRWNLMRDHCANYGYVI